MRAFRVAMVALLLALVFTTAQGMVFAQPPPPPYVIVIHPSNGSTSLERRFIEDAFLKKTTRWDNGELIRPVDLPPESAVRQTFTSSVIRRSVAAVRSYWQQSIFAGRDVPPPELNSDDEVIHYVQTHPGGVGYVSGSASTGTLRVVVVR
jgi:ABC-type phosphate transport system substrate-binding protein